jgi:Condensation domain
MALIPVTSVHFWKILISQRVVLQRSLSHVHSKVLELQYNSAISFERTRGFFFFFADVRLSAYLIQMNQQGILGLSNYIYEVEGFNLPDGLQRVVELLVSKNPILRTAIIQSSQGFLQVLLTESKLPIIQATSLDDYVSQTKLPMLPFGRPIVQYCLTKNNEGQNFFVISIHHAFFDAFSRSILEADLLHALRTPSTYALEAERPWYGDFSVHLHAAQKKTDTYQYWHKYMQGATMENIHIGHSLSDNPDGSLHGAIDVSTFIKGSHISSSSAVIASWALALANHSGLKDILFAVAKLGRSYPYEGVDRILGPLVMVAPFRLRVDDTTTSTSSLLHRVQKDLISTGQYEEGLIPGAVPSPDGGACVQSLINVKSSVSSMRPTAIDSDGKGGVSKISPRRDLEHWDIRASYAIYIEVTPQDKDMIVDFRYHSQHIEHEKARLLFADFLDILKALGLSTAGNIAELLKKA